MPIQLPPSTLKQIAEYLDMGMLCFYNKTTGELESYPDELEYSGLEEEWAEITGKIEASPDNYFQIEAMGKRESFQLMETFTNEIEHTPTRNKFLNAISVKKPFAHFKSLLSYYPELREQWFPFKLERYIEFVKKQVEAYNLENDPILSLYSRLEYHLSEALENSPDNEINRLWCDGIYTDDHSLSVQTIIETHKIEAWAYIATGSIKQEKYEMAIKLGPDALKRYADGESMVDCLPGAESLDWVMIDMEKKVIELQLN